MAPHDTNTPKEVRRHAVPLIGIVAVVLLVLVGFVWWVGVATQGPDQTEANPVEQNSTGPATN